jgi:haloalkane dehalogenase
VSADHLAAGLAYRAAGSPNGPAVLLLHGYPESSFMWRGVLPALGDAGWRALAPDLAGYGDSEPDPPGTWERHVEALERFAGEQKLDPVVLVMHDWGVLIGLRWACDHPARVRALVISDGGFFADGRWHDLAKAMRTPGDGERLLAAYTRDGFGGALRGFSAGITDEALDEYWKAFGDEPRRRGQLDLYRSGDFDKLAPYEGRVAALGLPTLIVWGGQDRFASVKAARRFHAEIPASELALFDEAGHFVWEDAPEQATAALLEFLERRAPPMHPRPPHASLAPP